MKALLICPARRATVASLTEATPLAITPFLGKNLVEYWLEHLASLGARHVRVLAVDRPEQVRRQVGDGSRWGLCVDVLPVARELTVDQARTRHRPPDEPGWLPAPHDAVLADRLPAMPEPPLTAGYADWFAAAVAWMPRAATADRIGLRQLQPGVWCGLNARVSARARLFPPCWIGEHVWIGPDAVIGPESVVENRVFVDARAEITRSVVGPETYVGQLAQVRESLVCGNQLINWRTGSCSEVPDPFLLGPLDVKLGRPRPGPLWSRAAAVAGMGLTLPLATVAMAKALLCGRPLFARRVALRPSGSARGMKKEPLTYYELDAARGWLRRWPQLLSIARGDFAWVGNRPLEPAEAIQLSNDFERLWLAAPIGLVSLADANGCREAFSDEARAHASFYAVSASPRLKWVILWRAALAGFRAPPRPGPALEYPAPLRPLAGQKG